MELNAQQLAGMIDHTELNAWAGRDRIRTLCEEAKAHRFAAVCVNPVHGPGAVERLRGSGVKTCIVTGFPLGASRSEVKALEARRAVEAGVEEVDMVLDVGALRDGRLDDVRDDIRRVVDASNPALVKVILETCMLLPDQIVTACHLAVEAGARFVKTSTGFGAFGAFPEHLRLMRRTVGDGVGVKASGGVRTLVDAWRMVEAGANRIGCSASLAIVKGFEALGPGGRPALAPASPCDVCPAKFATAGKHPPEVLAYYQQRCRTCPDAPAGTTRT